MLRALSLACLAGGAGFRPSTDSDSRSSPEALGEMGNVDFGFWAVFCNLVGFNVSQSTSAQAGCSRVLGSNLLAAMPGAGWAIPHNLTQLRIHYISTISTVDAQWTLSGRYSGRLVDATVDSIKTHTLPIMYKKAISFQKFSFHTLLTKCVFL